MTQLQKLFFYFEVLTLTMYKELFDQLAFLVVIKIGYR